MGWFSNLLSATSNFVSKAASAATSVAQSTWAAIKRTAAKVVTWVANHGESTVAKAKDLWKAARPYVAHATTWLHKAGMAHPLIKKVAVLIDGLLALEKSPVLQWLDKAVTWIVEQAKRLNAAMEEGAQVELNDAERAHAEQYQQSFRDAQGSFSGEQAYSISVVAMINDLVLAQHNINALVKSGEVVDVDHFLRLRATQKLLKEANIRFAKLNEEALVSADDIFLVRVAADLLAPAPTLSETDAQTLDQLLQRRYNCGLLPFAFEELLPAWHMRNEVLNEQWKVLSKQVAQKQVLLRRLESDLSVSIDGRLSDEEQAMLNDLRKSLPLDRKAFETISAEKLALSHYLHAAEGFLQVLEKSAEELEATGMGYLIGTGQQVGELIIQGAEQGKRWEQFSTEEQDLIIDFANIFEEECLQRVQRLVEVSA
ncbi:hypothetical protein [Stenotrophomonas sp.]|uniref:hypothetical protein n=1 Tax=Stenotrophomonas sp. TaxID=69392 RepID=UPI0028A9F910|nr:hypothetical protein [Stenotrophomonas sp.]